MTCMFETDTDEKFLMLALPSSYFNTDYIYTASRNCFVFLYAVLFVYSSRSGHLINITRIIFQINIGSQNSFTMPT